MDRAFDRLSEPLVALGQSLQQDFAPILGPGNDLPPGVAWEDLPALDGVAADWATITIMADTLSTLYRWLTTDLLGTEGSEAGGLSDIPLSPSPSLTGDLPPLSRNPAKAGTAMDWGHQDEGGASEIASISNRAQEAHRLSMAWDDSETSARRKVADGQPGQTASIPTRPPEGDRSRLDGGASQPQIIQPNQPQPSAMAPRSSAAMAPIVGGFQDLAARLAGSGELDRISPSEVESAEAKDLVGGAQSTGALYQPEGKSGGHENLVGNAHPTGISNVGGFQDLAARLADSGGLDRISPSEVESAEAGDLVGSAHPTATVDPRNLARRGTEWLIDQRLGTRDHAGSGMAPATTNLTGSELTHWSQSVSQPQPSGPIPSGSLPPSSPDNTRDHAPSLNTLKPSPLSEVRAAAPRLGTPPHELAAISSEQLDGWATARSPDDLDDIMDAITHTITRDYHRFYGP